MYATSALGEVLPTSGPLYSAQDAIAAGIVQQVTRDWAMLKSGAEMGANFDAFQEAVKFGWVPDTPAGYDLFLGSQSRQPSAAELNALPEFFAWARAWQWAFALSYGGANWTVDQAPTLWQGTLQGWIAAGMTPDAANVADAAFRRYFPGYLARFGSLRAPALPVADAGNTITNQVTGVVTPVRDILYAGPFPNRPGTVLFQLKTGQTWTWAGTWSGPVIGTPAPPQTLLDSLAAADAAKAAAAHAGATLTARTYEAVLIHPTVDPGRYFAVKDPTLYSPKYQRQRDRFSDGIETVTPWNYDNSAVWLPLDQWRSPASWGSDVLGPLWPGRVTIQLWEALSPSERAALSPLPPVAVETAAQGQQYQPTPAAAAPPPTTAPAPGPSATPGAVTPGTAPTPATTAIVPGSAPGNYAVPGGAQPLPSGPEPLPSTTVQAGLPSGVLIAGGILAAVLLLRKRGRGGRVKGYRRY